MKVKKHIVLEAEIDDNKIELSCNEACPLGVLWDGVNQMRQFVWKQLEQQQAQMEAQEAEEKSAEEPQEAQE